MDEDDSYNSVNTLNNEPNFNRIYGILFKEYSKMSVIKTL